MNENTFPSKLLELLDIITKKLSLITMCGWLNYCDLMIVFDTCKTLFFL